MTRPQDEPREHANSMPQAGEAAVPTANAGEASNHLGQDDGADVSRHESTDGGKPSEGPKPSDRMPSAGPHADPALMNPDATPGTGALPDPGDHDNVDATG
jgi:hypothetical protein